MNIEEIKNRIDSFQVREMFNNDPVSFLWKYKDKRDIEVAAVICSVLAFGSRKQIYKACEKTLALMGDSPYEYITKNRTAWGQFEGDFSCWYRMLAKHHFFSICFALQNIYTYNDSLEDIVEGRAILIKDSYLESLISLFGHLIGFPKDSKSCCKRLMLLLRWLVRRDSQVDVGIWTKLDPAKLLLPMDVHSLNTARKYGFLKRKSNDMKAVLEVTEWARTICPNDPASLDFFLFGESYAEAHPDEVMVKMTPNQMILTAVYQTMYLNELVCLCVHDIKPSIAKIDKESQKIYKAALRRVREYESWMANIMSTSGNVYSDFNDIMDDSIRPLVDEFRNELYDFFDEEKNVENPYVCTLVELARMTTKLSITEIGNRIRDTLKYDKSAVSLHTYEQHELLTILSNLSKWLFRKQKEDINLNESTYLVNAWTNLVTAINNSDTIASAIVKAQKLNDKENDIK